MSVVVMNGESRMAILPNHTQIIEEATVTIGSYLTENKSNQKLIKNSKDEPEQGRKKATQSSCKP